MRLLLTLHFAFSLFSISHSVFHQIFPENGECLYHFVRFDAEEPSFFSSKFDGIRLLTHINQSNTLERFDLRPHILQEEYNCRVKVFTTLLIKHDFDQILWAAKSLHNIKENPNYIIIISPIGSFSKLEATNQKIILKLFREFRSIPITSKLLMLFDSNAFIVDYTARRLNQQLVSIIIPTHLEEVDLLWSQVYSNMKGLYVNVPLLQMYYMMRRFLKVECNRLGIHFAGSERFCMLKILESHLNYTIIEDPMILLSPTAKSKALVHIITGPVFSTLERREKVRLERLEVLPLGQTIIPFGFVIVMDKSHLEVKNPLTAFDKMTWMSLLSSVIILVFAITANKLYSGSQDLKINTEKKLEYFSHVMLVIVSVMFDQCPSHTFSNSNKIKNRNQSLRQLWLIRLLLLIWLFTNLVICGGFKGVFFSFLTSTRFPKTPNTLLELIEMDNFQLVALDSLPIKGPGSPWTCLFDNLIFQYIQSLPSNVDILLSSRAKLYLKAANKTVQTLKLTYGKIKVLYDNHIPFKSGHVNDKFKDFVIPQDFAAISSKEGVSHFHKLMKISGQQYLAQCKEFDHFLSIIETMVVTRNFFIQPFIKGLSSLKESGIYGIWGKYYSTLQLNGDAFMMNCLEKFNKSDAQLWQHDICTSPETGAEGSLEDKTYRPKEKSLVLKEARSLPLKIVHIVFLALAVGLGIGLICIVGEILSILFISDPRKGKEDVHRRRDIEMHGVSDKLNLRRSSIADASNIVW